MNEAEAIADATIEWLREHYREHRFYVERDVVWTVQCRLRDLIEERGSALRVFNDHPVLPGKNRARSADLALIQPSGEIEFAIEFKYEPAHDRHDILKTKLPVVFWGKEGVAKDVDRIREMVETGRVSAARAYFIDEGGYFRQRPPHPGSEWVHWFGETWVLVARV